MFSSVKFMFCFINCSLGYKWLKIRGIFIITLSKEKKKNIISIFLDKVENCDIFVRETSIFTGHALFLEWIILGHCCLHIERTYFPSFVSLLWIPLLNEGFHIEIVFSIFIFLIHYFQLCKVCLWIETKTSLKNEWVQSEICIWYKQTGWIAQLCSIYSTLSYIN